MSHISRYINNIDLDRLEGDDGDDYFEEIYSYFYVWRNAWLLGDVVTLLDFFSRDRNTINIIEDCVEYISDRGLVGRLYNFDGATNDNVRMLVEVICMEYIPLLEEGIAFREQGQGLLQIIPEDPNDNFRPAIMQAFRNVFTFLNEQRRMSLVDVALDTNDTDIISLAMSFITPENYTGMEIEERVERFNTGANGIWEGHEV